MTKGKISSTSESENSIEAFYLRGINILQKLKSLLNKSGNKIRQTAQVICVAITT